MKTNTPANIFSLAQSAVRKDTKRGRKSILAPHAEAIRYLRSAKHFSFKQIHSFFDENGVKCTYQNLLNFVKSNKIGAGRKKKVS